MLEYIIKDKNKYFNGWSLVFDVEENEDGEMFGVVFLYGQDKKSPLVEIDLDDLPDASVAYVFERLVGLWASYVSESLDFEEKK